MDLAKVKYNEKSYSPAASLMGDKFSHPKSFSFTEHFFLVAGLKILL